MIHDLLLQHPEHGRKTDVCIVGAGAAGITLAVELDRLGRTVTLLEAGGELIEERSQRSVLGECAGLPHRGLHKGRARALGGTTHLWGGQILELDALDFEPRPWIAESGWPFHKSELTRHYERALVLEGVAQSMPDDAAVWQAVKQHIPKLAHMDAYLSRWCPEPNFARLHEKKLHGQSRIDLWLHAYAIELLLEGETVRGVRCKTQARDESTFVADTYVFCLGAIESSRFFLQPRGGGLPWNHSGLLGKQFQDHLDCDAATVDLVSPRKFHQLFDTIFLKGHKYNPKLKLAREIQQQYHTLQAGATFFSVSEIDNTLLEVKQAIKGLLRRRFNGVRPPQLAKWLRHSPTLLQHSYRYAVQHRAYHPASAQVKMRVHCEQQPTSASAIALNSERDEFGMFRARLSWQISSIELLTIRRFIEVAQSALAGLARIIPHPELMLGDNSFIQRCEDSFHHMGGMRMHASPRCGVVDPDLRLNGTLNAYVCSSAVYPTSGFSNPTHTLLALAVRLAEHLDHVL